MLAALAGIFSANHIIPVACVPDTYYYGAINDPYFPNVSLLLHLNGVNNGTVFTDNSSYARTATRVGSAVTSTAQFRFGTASLNCPTASGISYPYDASLNFINDNFTIEGWARNDGTTGYSTIIDFRGTSLFNTSWAIFVDNVNRTLCIYNGPTATTTAYTPINAVPAAGIWFHWAIVRNGTIVTFFINGISVGSGTYNAPATNATGVRVGINQASADNFQGYLDDIRITKGIARYIGNFIIPSAAFPDATEASNTSAYISYSTPGTGITVSSPTPATFRIEASSSSSSSYQNAYLNVRGDGKRYIEYVIQGAGSAGSGGRGYFVGFADTSATLPGNPNSITNGFFAMNFNYNGGSPGYILNNSGFVSTGAYDYVQNDVIGMAIDHSSGRFWMRKNGATWIGGGNPETDSTPTGTLTNGATVVPAIYSYARGSGFTGDWQTRALIQGDTFNATAPTGFIAYSGLWVDEHTILSLHGESIVDSSSQPKVLVNSGAAISTLQKKFGASSMVFSGTSQYIKSDVYQDFYFESNPYTIECWVYPTLLLGKTRPIFTVTENLTGGFAFMSLQIVADGRLQVSLSPTTGGAGAVSITSSLTDIISINQWTHVAYTRVGNKAYIFINGNLVSASTTWIDYPAAKVQNIAIGAYANTYTDGTIGMYQGYIDEFRVTTGTARYTGNFTPPTAAFGNDVAADPSFASVILLTHADGTNGSTTVVDNSAYNRIASVSGAAALSTSTFKYGTASIYLSSVAFGAYSVTWPNSTDFNISSVDFTIEMWAYELTGSLGSLISRRIGGNASGWAFTTSGLRAMLNGVWSDTQMSWTRPTQNAWHHYAWVRSGSRMYAFVDGVLVSTVAASSVSDQGLPIYLGQADNASENKFLGYIDEVRWTRGKARYLQDFTPPSLPNCNGLT